MRIRDARQTFLGVWLRNAITKTPIQVFGSGDQLRDFNFVEDCIHGLLLAAVSDSLIGGIYNLGGSQVVSLKDLASIICEIVPGAKFSLVPFPEDRKSIDIGDYYGCFKKFETLTGWSPVVKLKQGLKLSVEFYQKNGAHYGI